MIRSRKYSIFQVAFVFAILLFSITARNISTGHNKRAVRRLLKTNYPRHACIESLSNVTLQSDSSIALEYVSFRHPCEMKAILNHSSELTRMYPVSLQRFDWVIYDSRCNFTNTTNPNPKTIFFHMKQEYAHSTKENLIESLPSLTSGQSRSLVMAGDDAHLSRKAIRKMITKFIEKKLFSSYWYEGKDVEWNDVNTIPMGFILSYIENSGYANVYQAVLKSDQNPKTKLLLAAWGAVWKVLDTHPERKPLVEFIEKSKWIKRDYIEASEYWNVLADYKFLLAPWGNGIQSPKFFEAFMVKTVCVTLYSPTFHDLRMMGFPFILVNEWEELTEEFLEAWYRKYYHRINWYDIRNLMRVDVMEDLVTERFPSCMLNRTTPHNESK